MAIRPATRGGDGLTYGVIALAITTVAALGAFIWQLTANGDLKKQADAAAAASRKFGTPPAWYDAEHSARGTPIFNAMETDMKELARLATGRSDAVRPAVEDEVAATLKDLTTATDKVVSNGDTLVGALRKLGRAYADLKSLNAQLKSQLDEQQAENATLAEGSKVARDEYVAEIAKLKEEITRLETDKNDTLGAKDKQVADMQTSIDSTTKDLNDARTLLTTTRQENEIAVGRLNRQIDGLLTKLRELQPTGRDVTDILAKADGSVLRAVPGSDVVYISLGKADGVRPGMGFEVFSPSGERSVDFRGKARVEVVSVEGSTSECKVTRETRGKPIVEGDTIVNIAYEKNRKTKFVVRGDFDMNYDGEPDWDGLEKVTAMIRDFGGMVVPEIDETVDFVVLGTSPLAPSITVGRPISKIVEDLVAEKKRRGEDWTAIIASADRLHIPVLPQAQFLFLIGFGGPVPLAAASR